MTERDLTTLLRELHDALASNESLGDDDQALAAIVRADLDRALAMQPTTPDPSLAPKLESAIERFEGRHPELVEAARRLLDQLANVGI